MQAMGRYMAVWCVTAMAADTFLHAAPEATYKAQQQTAEPQPLIGDPPGPNVALIRVDGMIYDFTLKSLQRRIDRALEEGATIIVIELNTPGGVVTSALKISKYIKTLTIPTVAWINNEAYSAGIMIASACDSIVMSTSAATGDCAPIRMDKELAPTERAKALSPILEEFRDSAQRNGYDYAMFHAMCVLGIEVYQIEHNETGKRMLVNQADYHLMVKGLSRDEAIQATRPNGGGGAGGELSSALTVGTVTVEASKEKDRGQWKLVDQIHDGTTLLTVNQTRAQKIGLSKKTITSADALSSWLGAKRVTRIRQSWSEDLVAWLVHPAIRAVLVMALMLGAYMEFQSPGLGLPGAVAAAALITLLGAPFLVGLAEMWHVIIFFLGFILLMVELFVTPGFGLLGAAGLMMMFVGMVFSIVPLPGSGPAYVPTRVVIQALRNSVLSVLVGSMVASGGIILLIRYFGSMPLFNRLVLQTAQVASTGAMTGQVALSGSEVIGSGIITVGAAGRVISELRPTGRADIDGQLVDVVTVGQWVAIGKPVRVVEVHGNRIVVEATS